MQISRANLHKKSCKGNFITHSLVLPCDKYQRSSGIAYYDDGESLDSLQTNQFMIFAFQVIYHLQPTKCILVFSIFHFYHRGEEGLV